jgi:hypothetical protein
MFGKLPQEKFTNLPSFGENNYKNNGRLQLDS